MPAEKGVRHGHTEALSGTAVLGGEGHFSLLDTVGDRGEGGSSIGGLLGRGEREKAGRREKAENGQHSWQRVRKWIPNSTQGCSGKGCSGKGWGLAAWLNPEIRNTCHRLPEQRDADFLPCDRFKSELSDRLWLEEDKQAGATQTQVLCSELLCGEQTCMVIPTSAELNLGLHLDPANVHMLVFGIP
jgi:hypothetical protein